MQKPVVTATARTEGTHRTARLLDPAGMGIVRVVVGTQKIRWPIHEGEAWRKLQDHHDFRPNLELVTSLVEGRVEILVPSRVILVRVSETVVVWMYFQIFFPVWICSRKAWLQGLGSSKLDHLVPSGPWCWLVVSRWNLCFCSRWLPERRAEDECEFGRSKGDARKQIPQESALVCNYRRRAGETVTSTLASPGL